MPDSIDLRSREDLPLYEYECASCGQAVDKRHGFDETNTDKCEHCGGDLKRRFSATGIVFKGSGFYVTDSRAKASSNASSSTSGKKTETASTQAKSESPSDSKSDAPKAEPAKSETATSEAKKSDAAA
ncbi:MAG TPA: FmdB family zinc ribbon protein [Candidatus Acidoferrales bacterium]|nr:FmdB family zinc ribbon protein [Candidatus Acidoferrales bacterium]